MDTQRWFAEDIARGTLDRVLAHQENFSLVNLAQAAASETESGLGRQELVDHRYLHIQENAILKGPCLGGVRYSAGPHSFQED